MKKFNEFLNEAKDDGEYGQQGGMAKSQLRMIMSAAKRLHDSLKDDDVLPGHIIANIVLASDYVTGSADYMESEMDDEYDDDEMDDMDEEVEQINENPFNQRLQKAPGGETLPAPAKGAVKKHGMKFKEGDMVVPHTGPHAGVPHKVTTARAGTVNIHPMVSLNKHKYDNTTIRAKHEHLSPYKQSVKEEVEFAEEQTPAYHYYATKNGIGAKEMKLTHAKSKPFTSETDALKHIVKTGGRQDGIIHKVNSATGKVVQHRGIDGGQKGYPTPASDMASDAPKHVRDLKEEVADLRITKVYNKFPKKATYAVHTSDRKYYKEFDNEAAAKAHHAERSGK